MRKYHKILTLFLLLTLLLSLLCVSAIADFGSYSGGSDYGGGGSSTDWGSSSDWGSSGDTYYYSSGDSSDSGGGSWLTIIVAGVIFLIVILGFIFKGRKGNAGPVAPGAEATSLESLKTIPELKEIDPNFSEEAMKQKISNLYVQMQNAWQNKDLESLRPYFTDAQFNQFDRQLDEFKKSGCTNYIERIAVLDVSLRGWSEDETNEKLVAMLNTRIIDYTVNDKSGEVVSGDKRAERFMTYEWTLIRSKGMKTPEETESSNSQGTTGRTCPKCGAPLDLNQSAKCPYCGSVISAQDYDWVIAQIKGIAQRTGN